MSPHAWCRWYRIQGKEIFDYAQNRIRIANSRRLHYNWKKKNENPNRVYAFAHKDGSVQWIVYVAVNQFGTISQSKLQYEKWRTLRIWLYTQELHWFLLLSSVATEMRFVAVLSISRTESIDIAVSCHLWPPSISILVAFGICTPRNRSTKNVTVNSLPA